LALYQAIIVIRYFILAAAIQAAAVSPKGHFIVVSGSKLAQLGLNNNCLLHSEVHQSGEKGGEIVRKWLDWLLLERIFSTPMNICIPAVQHPGAASRFPNPIQCFQKMAFGSPCLLASFPGNKSIKARKIRGLGCWDSEGHQPEANLRGCRKR
jgi:hypothetical protein